MTRKIETPFILPKAVYHPSGTFKHAGRVWCITAVAHTGKQLAAKVCDGKAPLFTATFTLVDTI